MVSRPLPALTVEDLTGQLIWRVVGPLPWLRPRVHAALLWAGVSASAPFVRDVGARFGISHEAVRKWLQPTTGRTHSPLERSPAAATSTAILSR